MSNTIPHRVRKKTYWTCANNLINLIDKSKYLLACSSEDMTWDPERSVAFFNGLLEGEWPQPVRIINTDKNFLVKSEYARTEKCILNCHYELATLYRLKHDFWGHDLSSNNSSNVLGRLGDIDFKDFRYGGEPNRVFHLPIDPEKSQRPIVLSARIQNIIFMDVIYDDVRRGSPIRGIFSQLLDVEVPVESIIASPPINESSWINFFS